MHFDRDSCTLRTIEHVNSTNHSHGKHFLIMDCQLSSDECMYKRNAYSFDK